MVCERIFCPKIHLTQVTPEFPIVFMNRIHMPLQGLPVYKRRLARVTHKPAEFQMNTSDVIIQVTLLSALVIPVCRVQPKGFWPKLKEGVTKLSILAKSRKELKGN